MGCNSIFITIVEDPPCHICLFTVKMLGWSMPGWKLMKNLCLSTWRNCKMYRQRRVLFGFGFVCPSIQKTPRCWGVLRWTLRKSQRVCCQIFFVFSEKKNISHTKHHDSKVHCHHPTPILGNVGKPTGSGQISVRPTR